MIIALRMLLYFGLIAIMSAPAMAAQPFVHPGVLHTRPELERMKRSVNSGIEPWKGGFEKLAADSFSAADWRIRGPFEMSSRDSRDLTHHTEFWTDSNAAYQNALMWFITGEEAHAMKSAEILDAWSTTLKEIKGRDAILAASLYGDKLVNAAEILRYTYKGWTPQETEQCSHLFRDILYPVIKDFATFANGTWDTGCIKTMMGFGIFLDDRTMFDRAVDYYRHGSGNGSLTHYILFDTGQCQESGRDQQHTQLGIGHLVEACEIAWSQGIDLYSLDDNRLLKGLEYTAKYNLGNDVPFTPYTDPAKQSPATVISEQGRGRLRAIWEMAWNHYGVRKRLPAPYTRQAAEKLRPEGPGFQADHPGYGTLLFTIQTSGRR